MFRSDPTGFLNVGKSEKKRQQALAAQLERLRPFGRFYAAMNAPVTYSGGDGLSFDDAIIIVGANVVSGPRAEHDYIQGRFPGYEFHRQCLKEHKGRKYDLLEFTTAAGESKAMYFDISAHHLAKRQ